MHRGCLVCGGLGFRGADLGWEGRCVYLGVLGFGEGGRNREICDGDIPGDSQTDTASLTQTGRETVRQTLPPRFRDGRFK